MANYQILKADIDEKIYENAQQKITGENLNSVLNAMVATLGAEYQFAGVATIDTNPETSDAKVFYIANGKGTYTNFGGINVTEDDVVILYYDTSWHKVATGIASQAKVTELEEEIGGIEAETEIVKNEGYYISSQTIGEKVSNGDFFYSNPIPLKRGDKIRFVCTAWPTVSTLSKYINEEYYRIAIGNGVDYGEYSYTADEDCEIVVSGYKLQYRGTYITSANRLDRAEDDIQNIKDNALYNNESVFIKGRSLAKANDSYNWERGYYVNSNGDITPNQEFMYNKTPIPVFPNTNYLIVSEQRERDEGVRFIDSNGNKCGFASSNGNAPLEFMTNKETRFIQFSCTIVHPAELLFNDDVTLKRVEEIANAVYDVTDDSSLGIIKHPVIFGRTFNESSSYLRANNSIFPEGFSLNGEKLCVDGGKEYSLNDVNAPADRNVDICIENIINSKKKNVSVSVKSTNPASVNGKALVLVIGESTTEAVVQNPYKKEFDGGWAYPSSLRMYSMMDRYDNVGADVITLGSKSGEAPTINNIPFTYKGDTLRVRSFNEGHSGWASYTFLNWPCMAKFSYSTDRFYAESMWYALGLATKTPYNQESYNTDREGFGWTEVQLELMSKTPLGKYKIDGSDYLWNAIQVLSKKSGYPSFNDSSTYTGSETQIAEMQTWMDELANNPINPFYSLNEARNGSSGTAFSLDTYLDRYRTLDDSGNRLTGQAGASVVGEDGRTYKIGTRVSNTTDWDVCSPTHIILNVGINDSEGGNKSHITIDNIKKFVSLFSVPTAYFICRIPGVCSKSMWSDVAVAKQYIPMAHNAEVVNGLVDWFAEQTDKYLLPIYLIQNPASVVTEFVEGTELYPHNRLNTTYDNVHCGWDAHRSIGLQCLHWIYYTL